MSSNGDNPFQGAATVTKMWADLASALSQSGMMFAPSSSPPDVVRQMRSTLLSAWADYFDQYMRTEEFQQAMKQSLAAAVQTRKQMNELLGRMRHELQGASRQDIDQLMLSLRHLERRIVDGMERLSTRLDDVAGRVEAVEKRLTGDQGSPSSEDDGSQSETE